MTKHKKAEAISCGDPTAADAEAAQQWRNKRWAEYVHRTNSQGHGRLDAVGIGSTVYTGPIWWEIWPGGSLKGQISTRVECEYIDAHLGFGYGVPCRTLLSAEKYYLDFYPDDLHDLYAMFDINGRVTAQDFVQPWGWWDSNKRRIRTRAYGVAQYEDGTVAVKIVTPPPYGHWMPSFALNL